MIARLLVTALFALLGGLGFVGREVLDRLGAASPAVARGAMHPAAPAMPPQVEAALLREAERRGLHLEDGLVRDRLVRNMRFAQPESEADDEALFQMALELGMHRSDPIARARLCERSADQMLAEAPPEAASRAELQSYLEQHAARFRRPGMVAFRQVVLREGAGGQPARARAEALLKQLRDRGPRAAEGQGDPSLLPAAMEASEARVASRFGARFAGQLADLEVGRWQGPLESRFGVHLVFVEHRSAERLPELGEIAEAVRAEHRHDTLQQRRRALLDALSERHASATEVAP